MKPIELSEGEVETLWLDEAERREQAWDAGEAIGIPSEQVMLELRSDSGDGALSFNQQARSEFQMYQSRRAWYWSGRT